jgi:predicted RNA-binding protein YlxR (DUF448 family)
LSYYRHRGFWVGCEFIKNEKKKEKKKEKRKIKNKILNDVWCGEKTSPCRRGKKAWTE